MLKTNTNVKASYLKLKPTEYQQNLLGVLSELKDDSLTKNDIIDRLGEYLPPKDKFRLRLSNKEYLDKQPKKYLLRVLRNCIKRKIKGISLRREKTVKKPDFKDYFSVCPEYRHEDFSNDHYLRRDYATLPIKRVRGWIDPEWVSYSLNDKEGGVEYLTRLSVKERRNLNIAFNNIKDLLHYIFMSCSSVQVIRVDFHPKELFRQDINRLNRDFSKLLLWLHNHDKGFIGYYATRELGSEEEGIHLHCYMFFNGKVVKNDVLVSKQLKSVWRRISKGGRSYFGNMSKEKYSDGAECLGLVRYTDLATIEKLVVLSKYLIKDLSNRDWLVGLKLNPRSRLFTCSSMPDFMARFNDYYDRLALGGVETRRKFLVDYRWLDKIQLKNGPPLFSGEDGLLRMKNYVRLNPHHVKEANYVPLDVLERRVTNSEYFSKHGEMLSKLD